MSITVTSFYHFTPIATPLAHQSVLLEWMRQGGIKGTVTLASEGVNATISGSAEAVATYIDQLQSLLNIQLPMARESYTGEQPFQRAKVKVKRELISLGAPADPSACVGRYVQPKDWNALIRRPDVVIIDTRNDYEFQLGHFRHAVNPGTRNFKQMVAFTNENLAHLQGKIIAMYCTGGIRCEKYSAYLLTQGFAEIYHLHGGILAYLEQIPASESLWTGTCFVFDERVSVGPGLIATPPAVAALT